MEKKDLLKLRKAIKTRKPNFVRQDSHKKAEIKERWRSSRGLQSKMRLHRKGYRKSPSKGYRSPAAVRGLHTSGLIPVNASSQKDLEIIDTKKEGAIIAKAVGIKKKISLVKYAKEKGIKILNIKDVDNFLAEIDKKLKDKKAKKEERKKEKEAKKKEGKEKKKEKLSEKLTEEEKKEQEKKEKDRLLTQKEA